MPSGTKRLGRDQTEKKKLCNYIPYYAGVSLGGTESQRWPSRQVQFPPLGRVETPQLAVHTDPPGFVRPVGGFRVPIHPAESRTAPPTIDEKKTTSWRARNIPTPGVGRGGVGYKESSSSAWSRIRIRELICLPICLPACLSVLSTCFSRSPVSSLLRPAWPPRPPRRRCSRLPTLETIPAARRCSST